MSFRTDSSAPAMLNDLKVANRRRVISCFRRGAVTGAGDISQQTGISRPTVVKCIRFFLGTGLLVSQGKGKSTAIGGKRPETYALSGSRYFLTLALWPQEQRAFLFTIGHTLLGSITLPEALPETAEDTGRKAAALASRLLREQCVQPGDVCAVAVSTSGTVDRETETLIYSSHTPQWGTSVHLLDDLRALFGPGIPIYMENAAKMCARPFLLDPTLRRQRVLVLFTTWGLSGCMMERGHIMSGHNALIGEIGHMTLDPSDPEPCGCGSCGCFERLVSPTRMRRLVQERAHEFPGSSLPGRPELTIPQLFEASRAGDPLAVSLSRHLASHFAHALRNISLVFDPDCVILQGDYAAADEAFRTALSQALSGFRYFNGHMPFLLQDDRRPLSEMDAEGAFIALDHLYFGDAALYQDDSPEE